MDWGDCNSLNCPACFRADYPADTQKEGIVLAGGNRYDDRIAAVGELGRDAVDELCWAAESDADAA